MPQLLANGNITNHHLWSECLEFCKNGSCAGWQSGRNLTHDDVVPPCRTDGTRYQPVPLPSSLLPALGAYYRNMFGVCCVPYARTHTHTHQHYVAVRCISKYCQTVPNTRARADHFGMISGAAGTVPPPIKWKAEPSPPPLPQHRFCSTVTLTTLQMSSLTSVYILWQRSLIFLGRGATVAAFHYARKTELEQCGCVYVCVCIIITYFQ